MTTPMTTDLRDFASRVKGATPFSGLILAFDPGETTGFCAMLNFEVQELKQIKTPIDDVPQGYFALNEIIRPYYIAYGSTYVLHNPPIEVACEDYRIYDWKSDDHKWSAVHTIKIVGFVQLLAKQYGWPIVMRMAGTTKGFCTDKRLEGWGLYGQTAGLRHARDAVRHASYHSIFHKRAV